MSQHISLRLAEIRALISVPEAIAAVEEAFRALGQGRAVLPAVINLDLAEHHGEVHVKGAYLSGSEFYTIKVASGFSGNAALGLPAGNGLMLVFKAQTGELAALLFDEGWLTDLRTGAAGALCAQYLARPAIAQVGLIGTGIQARFQLDALSHVRTFERVVVWSRSPEHAAAYAQRMAPAVHARFDAARTVEEAVRGSELVVSVTPARTPLVRAEWLAPGQTLIAVGSDGPEKQELEPAVLARADRVVADSLAQCARLGEIHHALESGALAPERVSELGAIVSGRAAGRTPASSSSAT